MHLLQHWGDAVPPDGLRLRPKLGSTARILLGVLVAIAAALGAFMIVLLWVTPTPGWWFSVLFTVMITGLLLGLCVAYIGAVRSGAEREAAAARWVATIGEVRPTSGVVVARDVGTSDDGSVSRFELTVRTEHGTTVTGVWRPRSATRSLLQPQVPGVGGRARIWRVDGATDDEPLVIEVLDPTVATDVAGSGVDKYVD